MAGLFSRGPGADVIIAITLPAFTFTLVNAAAIGRLKFSFGR
jgi:hypothetical protein